MKQVTLQELPALGCIKLESTWMYAACDEASSAALSMAAVEVTIPSSLLSSLRKGYAAGVFNWD
jgi:hypothetical protein